MVGMGGSQGEVLEDRRTDFGGADGMSRRGGSPVEIKYIRRWVLAVVAWKLRCGRTRDCSHTLAWSRWSSVTGILSEEWFRRRSL